MDGCILAVHVHTVEPQATAAHLRPTAAELGARASDPAGCYRFCFADPTHVSDCAPRADHKESGAGDDDDQSDTEES